MRSMDADGMATSVDPRSSLIWVYTVCPDLSKNLGSLRYNYMYADDNTLSFHSPDFEEILWVLQSEGKILIKWYCFNCM